MNARILMITIALWCLSISDSKLYAEGSVAWDAILLDISTDMSGKNSSNLSQSDIKNIFWNQFKESGVHHNTPLILFAGGRKSISAMDYNFDDEQFILNTIGDGTSIFEAIISCSNLSLNPDKDLNILLISNGNDVSSRINIITLEDFVKANRIVIDFVYISFEEKPDSLSYLTSDSIPEPFQNKYVEPDITELQNLVFATGGLFLPISENQNTIDTAIRSLFDTRPSRGKQSKSKLSKEGLIWLKSKFPLNEKRK